MSSKTVSRYMCIVRPYAQALALLVVFVLGTQLSEALAKNPAPADTKTKYCGSAWANIRWHPPIAFGVAELTFGFSAAKSAGSLAILDYSIAWHNNDANRDGSFSGRKTFNPPQQSWSGSQLVKTGSGYVRGNMVGAFGTYKKVFCSFMTFSESPSFGGRIP